MNVAHAFSYSNENPKEPYHYTECGLDNVYLLSGYESEDLGYGEGVSVRGADQLHIAIGVALCKNRKTLNGRELRFLRREMEHTQSWLAALIGASAQSVARWEKSVVSPQPAAADYLIRLIYLHHVGHSPEDIEKLLESFNEMDSGGVQQQMFSCDGGDWIMRQAA